MSMVPVQFINPFMTAVKNICGETIKVPVSSGPMRLRLADERLWKVYPISVVIELKNAVRGMIAVSFAEPVAMALAEGLAMEKFKSFNEDARDALGEVANLIIGTAKRDLPGGLVTISTPKILSSHLVTMPAGMPTLILPFETAPGRFIMQLAMMRMQPDETSIAAAA